MSRPISPRVLAICAAVFMLFTCSAPLAPAGIGGAEPRAASAPSISLAAPAQPTATTQPPPAATRVPIRPTQPLPTASPSNDQLAGPIDRYLADLAAGGWFSGAVLVARGDQVILAKGYGPADSDRNLSNTAATRFRLASLTKQFTAMAIMQLQQQGRLNISDPICGYLDDCPAAWQPVTIRHLLNHTSGIVDYTDYLDYETTEGLPATPQQLVARFRDQPLAYTPGELYDYCNSGYVLLGLIIERSSGMPYSAYIQRAIFEPLGMSESGYDASETFDPTLASPYRSAGQKAGFLNATTLYAAGGLYSTVEDLYRWTQALSTEQLVKQPLLVEMFTPGNGSYGYGWKIERPGDRLRISHAGNMTGVSNFIARYPEQRVTIIVLSNYEIANSAGISDYIASLVIGS